MMISTPKFALSTNCNKYGVLHLCLCHSNVSLCCSLLPVVWAITSASSWRLRRPCLTGSIVLVQFLCLYHSNVYDLAHTAWGELIFPLLERFSTCYFQVCSTIYGKIGNLRCHGNDTQHASCEPPYMYSTTWHSGRETCSQVLCKNGLTWLTYIQPILVVHTQCSERVYQHRLSCLKLSLLSLSLTASHQW